MNLNILKLKINESIHKLYEEDAILFSRNNKKGLCERCIVFRFAYYLQHEFQDYYVDCDFNSYNRGTSELVGKPIMNQDGISSTKRFIDIIVHRRTFDHQNNYICFEIKKWNNYSREGTEKDRNNLQILTTEYGYEYGFYLILGRTETQTKYDIWSAGRILSTEQSCFFDEN